MAADWTQNTRALKFLIIGMTLALVAGLTLLVIGIARTSGELGKQIGTRTVTLPQGAELRQMAAGDGRLYLHLRHPDGHDSVLVLDAGNG
ncbi:MAG TPA: hypothetical protein VE631_00530, partial [Alphaproteobacteria bacterium]|nr:hypothetical protein [Alphaproteobacteria bacterium]